MLKQFIANIDFFKKYLEDKIFILYLFCYINSKDHLWFKWIPKTSNGSKIIFFHIDFPCLTRHERPAICARSWPGMNDRNARILLWLLATPILYLRPSPSAVWLLAGWRHSILEKIEFTLLNYN